MATVKYVDLAGLTHFKSKLDARFPILGTDGKVPSSYLPSYVDDVLEYTSISAFPSTGETGKIYVDVSSNKTYRWGGTSYVEISASLALGETSSTAYAGDKGKKNADAIATLRGEMDTTISDIGDITGDIVTLQGYFTTNESGIAKNADKLDGHDSTHFATASSVTTLQGYFTNGIANNADKLDGYDANHFAASSVVQELTSTVDGIQADYITEGQLDAAIEEITGGTGGSLGNRVANLETSVEMLESYIPSELDINDLLASQDWVLEQKYLSSVPLATSSAIGGIKIGYTTSDKNYAVQLSDGKAYVNVPWTNTTYGVATSSSNGLMSAAHFTKLESITTVTTAEINALFA